MAAPMKNVTSVCKQVNKLFLAYRCSCKYTDHNIILLKHHGTI